ncbi:MAG: helix-turn-helix transcriptional regulator [Clostridiales bacterium]|nr:helix-turn-helix transcriptional regulator [Clostridiales bacterium]
MSDIFDVSIGLRKMMKSRKLTISKLSDQSNIPEDTIKSIRSGKTKNPGIQTIIRLADSLDCSIDELIGHHSGHSN